MKTEDSAKNYCSFLCLAAFTGLNILFSVYLYRFSTVLETQKKSLLASLNVTSSADETLVFFNRVPKAGTSSLTAWLRTLSGRNDFDCYNYRVTSEGTDVEIASMDPTDIQAAVNFLCNSCPDGRDCCYYKHMHFIDYTKYNCSANPIYINMVRHPVERLYSWYYYVRSTNYIKGHDHFISIQRLKLSLDECILGEKPCKVAINDTEAMKLERLLGNLNETNTSKLEKNHDQLKVARILAHSPKEGEVSDQLGPPTDEVSSQLAYFCGYGPECHSGASSIRRLHRAMINVERHFAVVGVLEELDITIQVFEKFLPRYFSGLGSIERESVNTNHPKPQLSAQARKLLEEYLHEEILFYEFCRQRLHKQFYAMSL